MGIMGACQFGVLVLGTVGASLQPSVPRQPQRLEILVQAELDYLPAVKQRMTLEVTNADPATVLQKIREMSGVAIEVQGTLPSRPVLSASYRDAKTKVVLEWFAREVRLTYRAEPPNKLWVVVDNHRTNAPAKDAS